MFSGRRSPGHPAAPLALLLVVSLAQGAPQQQLFVVRSGPNPPDFLQPTSPLPPAHLLQPTRGLSQTQRQTSPAQGTGRQNQASPISVSQELLWLLEQVPSRQKSFLPLPSTERRRLTPPISSVNRNLLLDASLGRFSGSPAADNLDEIPSQRNTVDASFGVFPGPHTSIQNNQEDFISRRLFASGPPNPDVNFTPRLDGIQDIARSSNLANSDARSSPFQLVSSQPSTQDLLQIRNLQLQQLQQQQRLIELQNELLQYQRLLRQQPDFPQVSFNDQRSDVFPVTAVNSSPSNRVQQLLVPSQSNLAPRLNTDARLLSRNPSPLRDEELRKVPTPVSQVVHTVTQTVFVPVSSSDPVEDNGVGFRTPEGSTRIQNEDLEINEESRGHHFNALQSTNEENVQEIHHALGTNVPQGVDTQGTAGQDDRPQNFDVEVNRGVTGEEFQQNHVRRKGETLPLESDTLLDSQVETFKKTTPISEQKAVVSELESINFEIDLDVHGAGDGENVSKPDVETKTLFSEKSFPSTAIVPDLESNPTNDPNLELDVFIDALPKSQVEIDEIESTSKPSSLSSSDTAAQNNDGIVSPVQEGNNNGPELLLETSLLEKDKLSSLNSDDSARLGEKGPGESIVTEEVNPTNSGGSQVLHEPDMKGDSTLSIDLFQHSEDTTEKSIPQETLSDSLSSSGIDSKSATPEEEVSIVDEPNAPESQKDFSQSSHQNGLPPPSLSSPESPNVESDALVVEPSNIPENTRTDSTQAFEHHDQFSSAFFNEGSTNPHEDTSISKAPNAPENINDDFSTDFHNDALSTAQINTEAPETSSDILIIRDSDPAANIDEEIFHNSPHHHPSSAPLQSTHNLDPHGGSSDVFIVTDSDIHENAENSFDVKARVLSEPVADSVTLDENSTMVDHDDRQDIKTTLAPLVVESTSTLRIFHNNAEIITNSPPQSESLVNTVTPPSEEATTNMLPLEAMFEKFSDDHQISSHPENIRKDESFPDPQNHPVNDSELDGKGEEFSDYDEVLQQDSVKPPVPTDEESQHALNSSPVRDGGAEEKSAGEIKSNSKISPDNDEPSSNGTILVARGPLEIDFNAPRIVERTVISISSNINANSAQQAAPGGFATKSLSDPDHFESADHLAESHNVPTFTVFVNPKTGRIFKRSVPSVPEDMSSKLSEILKMKRQEMENANQRFKGRQGLFTLFKSEQNSEQSVSSGTGKSISSKNNEPVNKRPRSFLADRLTARKVSPVAEPNSDRRKMLSALRAQRMKKLQAFTATSSFSNRLGEAAPVQSNDEEVTETISDLPTSDTAEDGFVPVSADAADPASPDAAQESEPEASPAEESAKEDADKQLTLQEQLKKLLRNKNTEDKVRRRLLSSRRSFLQKKRAQTTSGDAEPSSKRPPSAVTDAPSTTTVRPLRFNRFRNQAAGRGTDRRDRVRSLASRFRSRNQENKPDVVAKKEEEKKVVKDEKPKEPSDNNNRRFKLTRFEGFRRRERPPGRRPFNRPALTTTQKPITSSTPKDDSQKTTTKINDTGDLTTQSTIFSDVSENLIAENKDSTESSVIKTSDLPPFMAKFKEIISKTTQSPEPEVTSTAPISPSNDEIFTPTLNEIEDEITPTPFLKPTTVRVEPERTSEAPVLTESLNFETTTQAIQTSPVTDAPIAELSTTEAFSDTTEILANTSPSIITVTSAPVPIKRPDEDAPQDKDMQLQTPTSFLENVISPRKFPAAAQKPVVKAQGATISDVFSRMLASIAEQKRKNAIRNEQENAKGAVSKTQTKEDESAIGSQFLGINRKSVFSKSPFDEGRNVVSGVPIHAVVAPLSSRTHGFRPRFNRLPVSLKPETTTTSTPIGDKRFTQSAVEDVEDAFAVTSSTTVGLEDLTPTTVSPIKDIISSTMPSVAHFSTTSTPNLENKSLKARLMKGNFSLLVDGELLEEVATVSQNNNTSASEPLENINLRLFDIPVIMNFTKTTSTTKKSADIAPVLVPLSTSTESSLADETFSQIEQQNHGRSDDDTVTSVAHAHVPFSFIKETVGTKQQPVAGGRSLQFDEPAPNKLPESFLSPQTLQTEKETRGRPLENIEIPAEEDVQAEDLLIQREVLPTTSQTPLFHEIFPSLFGANSEQRKESSDSPMQSNIQLDNTDSNSRPNLDEKSNILESLFDETDTPGANEMNFTSSNSEIEFDDSQSSHLKPVPLIPFQDEEQFDSQQFLNSESNSFQRESETAVEFTENVTSDNPFEGIIPLDDGLPDIKIPSIDFESEISPTTERAIPSSDFNFQEKLSPHQDFGLNIESPNNLIPVEQTTPESRGMIPERIDPQGSPILPELADVGFQDPFSPVIHSQLDRAFMPVVTEQPSNFIPSINIHAKNKVFAKTDVPTNTIGTESQSFSEDFPTEMPLGFTETSIGAHKISQNFEREISDVSHQPGPPPVEFNFNSEPSFPLPINSNVESSSDDSLPPIKEDDHSTLMNFISQLNPTTTSPFNFFNPEIQQPVNAESGAATLTRNEFIPNDFNELPSSSRERKLFTTEMNKEDPFFNLVTSESSSVAAETVTPKPKLMEEFGNFNIQSSNFAGFLDNSVPQTTPREILKPKVNDIGFNNAQSAVSTTDFPGSTKFIGAQENLGQDSTSPVFSEPKSIPEEIPQNSVGSPQILRTSLRDRRPSAVPQRTSGSLFPRLIPVEQPSFDVQGDTDVAAEGGSDGSGSHASDPSITKKKVIRITSLTLLTPSPPMNVNASPSPRELVPIPLQGESSLAIRRRRPGVRTRGGNARRISSRKRLDEVEIPMSQPEVDDNIRSSEPRTLSNIKRPDSGNVGQEIPISALQQNDFARKNLRSRSRGETREFTNEFVHESPASGIREKQKLLQHATPEVTETTSLFEIPDEGDEKFFVSTVATDEASGAQISSVFDDFMFSTTTEMPTRATGEEGIIPQITQDTSPEPIASADEFIHDTFDLESKVNENAEREQGFEAPVEPILPPVSDLNIDTFALAEQNQEQTSQSTPIHEGQTPSISPTEITPFISPEDDTSFASPVDESPLQDQQGASVPSPTAKAVPEQVSQGQEKSSIDVIGHSLATTTVPIISEDVNLADFFVSPGTTNIHQEPNANEETSIPEFHNSPLEGIISTTTVSPIETSTVTTTSESSAVPDAPVPKEDLSSASDNEELSSSVDSISSPSNLSGLPEPTLPELAAPTSQAEDNLHNLTNDELLLLDLLADIVDTPATLPINPEPESPDIFPQTGETATEQREPKSIDIPLGEFSPQNLHVSGDEFSKSDRKEQNFRDSTSSFQPLVHRARPVFPPPLPQFPQMPTITTPKPFANHFQFSNFHQENQQENRFGFSGNFPFHVFDSLTVNQPIRPRSVSSSSAPVNTVSPNFSFFQVFNPPQAASQRSPNISPFPFLGKSVVQRKPSVAFRESVPQSVMSPQHRTQFGRSLDSRSRPQPSTTNNNERSKIVSMRTDSGSLIFLPSEKVPQAMKIGMGTPLDISEMQKKSRRS